MCRIKFKRSVVFFSSFKIILLNYFRNNREYEHAFFCCCCECVCKGTDLAAKGIYILQKEYCGWFIGHCFVPLLTYITCHLTAVNNELGVFELGDVDNVSFIESCIQVQSNVPHKKDLKNRVKQMHPLKGGVIVLRCSVFILLVWIWSVLLYIYIKKEKKICNRKKWLIFS